MLSDGNGDYADFSNSSILDIGTNDMTIIARTKLDATQNTYCGIVTKGGGSSTDAGYAFFYHPSSGQLVMRLSNDTTNLWLNSNSSLGLNDGNWHTVGVALDRNVNAVFYVDGVAVGAESAASLSSSNIVNAGRSLQLGTWLGYSAYSLYGSMDYAKVLKRALSPVEMVTATR